MESGKAEFIEILDTQFNGCVHVTNEYAPEIAIILEFTLTEKELNYIVDLVTEDKAEIRREKISRYYYASKFTVSEIAKFMNVPISTVSTDVSNTRKNVLRELRKDVRANKKVLEQLVGLMVQCDARVREAWIQYQNIDTDIRILRNIIEDVHKKTQGTKAPQIEIMNKLIDAAKTIASMHSHKGMYLQILNKETNTLRDLFKDFGLCGKEALELIVSGGVDIDVKIEEVKTFLNKTVHLIRQEVKDTGEQKRIFALLAEDIKKTHFYGEIKEPSVTIGNE